MVENNEIIGMIKFPCCPKEKAGYYPDSHGHSSLKCPTCGKYAVFDWDHRNAVMSKAARGASHRFKSI